MFSRTATGISINASGLSAVRVRGPLAAPRLEKAFHRPLPQGALRFSLREPNVLDADTVVRAVREAGLDLNGGGTGMFLTLPHGVGRVMLLEVEEAFRGRSEGLAILRWKLGKKLSCDGDDLRLDFQQLTSRENGAVTVLVALAFRRVMEQYEELFAGANLPPLRIDFDCFNLCRLFERRLADTGEYLLLFVLDSSLGMMVFSEGKPVFMRIRERVGEQTSDALLHKEITCSLLSYRDRFPERRINTALCVVSPHEAPEVCCMVRDVFECDPVLLETRDVVSARDGVSPAREELFPFSVAIGAALRGL